MVYFASGNILTMGTRFNEDEQQQLIQSFESLGTKPKVYTADDLQKWMASGWQESLVTVVHAFVTSRVDYCNSLLYGISDYNIN